MSEFLEDRKVILKPIMKPGLMNGAGHDGEFMYTGTEIHFCLPYNIKKGRLESILSREEQAFFEHELGENLSIHNKVDNYWNKFFVKIRKDDRLMRSGYDLDLNDVMDNLRWRLLKTQPHVAPSWNERYDRGEYTFALVNESELVESKARITDKRKEAYKFLGKIGTSPSKMINFLRVYGKKPSKTATVDFLNAEIDKLIENAATIDSVLRIINDDNYEIKLFIEDAIEIGAILKKGRKYFLQGGDAINENDPSLDGTVSQLKIYKRDTDDIYLRIDTQIKKSIK
jgi:hypothetical protein